MKLAGEITANNLDRSSGSEQKAIVQIDFGQVGVLEVRFRPSEAMGYTVGKVVEAELSLKKD